MITYFLDFVNHKTNPENGVCFMKLIESIGDRLFPVSSGR